MLIVTPSQRNAFYLLIAVFFSVSTFRCLGQKTSFPVASNGVINLSAYDYHSPETVPLTGDWFFQWNRFADSTSLVNSQHYLTVPGTWRAYTGSHTLLPQDQGHCTYGLRIQLPEVGKIWSLRIPPIRTAYKLYINGQLLAQTGELATGLAMKPGIDSKVISFLVPGKEVFLLLQVSNYYYAYGGIWKDLQFGNPATVTKGRETSLLISSLIIGALLIIGLYHFVLFVLRRKDSAPLFFGILCLAAAFRELFNAESIFFLANTGADWILAVKALYAAFPISIISMILYLQSLFPSLISPLIKRIIIAINLAFLALILLTPATTYTAIGTLISPLAILECGYFLSISIRASRFRKDGSFILFCDMILLTLCVINDTFNQLGIIHTYFLLSSSIVFFTLCQSLLLAIRFSTAFARTEALTAQLQQTNQALEQMALKRQEAEQSKALEEVKTRFFSNITHEFRTPLTLIITPIENLLRLFTKGNGSVPDNSVLHQSLTTIHRNARQLHQLINQLLDLSRLESGSLPVRETQGNVSIFMEELVDSFRITAKSKGIKLVYQPETIPQQLLFDDDKWGKIGYNLLANALKYTDAGGTVVISLSASRVPSNGAERLRLTVSDTGIGIPPDKLPHVFNRFYQVDNSRTRSFEGTGIGLALVKELTDLLQGQVTAESQVGQGTTITVECPVRRPCAGHSLRSASPVTESLCPESMTPPRQLVNNDKLLSQNHQPLVLVVEDHQELRQLIADSLSDTHRVLTAADGREGWEICQAELPDLVLSDVMMPVLDGYQLCGLIKETAQTNHIAVILLTAKTITESRLKGLATGANDYLTKPFDQQELQLRVANLLRYQESLRQYHKRQLDHAENLQLPVSENPFLSQLYQTMEKHLDDAKLSVEDLAVGLAMSSRTLNRKLSSLLGMTVSEFIRTYRLRKAATLLRAGHPVAETAYMVGFESPSYFGQCFKELFTLSPSDYIRSVVSEN
ncbi:hypothetical protein GCM10027299_17120 [Larkinella ripae]